MLKKLFGFDSTKTTVRTEIIAGLTTFLTMSYILAVNPSMFSQLEGMPAGAVFTTTALAAIIGTLTMAFWGKLPFGLAPGMGLNAFFVYTVCMGMGYSWQFALTAVFIEGLIFILLTITNLREAIVNAIPASLKNAIGAGIGLFIAYIGFQNVGIIQANQYTLVQFFDFHGIIAKVGVDGFTWANAIAEMAPVLVAIFGLILIGVLSYFKVKGAVIISILAGSVLYYVLTLQVPSFDMSQIGQSFKDFGEIGLFGLFNGEAWSAAFTAPFVGGVFSAIILISSAAEPK